MFNKRWKRVLLWTLSVLVVLGVGGLFAANYAVDKFMNSMVGGLEVELEPSATPPVNNDVAVAPTSTAELTETPIAEPTAEPAEATITEPAVAPTTTSSTNLPKSEAVEEGYTAQISTDKAKQIQENVTVKEKADVVSIVLGQLSMSDIKHLQALASGGLNLEEKKEARSIILSKVSEAQYNELIQIAKKYGVSEGKTHDQVIAEEQGSE